jgi:hypothetical protein
MGTTLLWTERYARAAHPLRERLGAVGFAAALLVLVAGAAGLCGLQASFPDAVAAALQTL